ncbi:carboxypeptidase-like regulatory domain-containing protein [Tenacibaculum ovolyticum]|uniref:carboxypeptidase-like regulatory domain-containing protein n=1 Tax=Tenacibaculum ovolyticum TaxID=104270 RepID=UPI0022F3BDF6|nr:carboxypeptidase-like regulatory domain-containing protein [Tenacibaculum ovolyticum]WBX78357.1 carboxypeptidase-like regulatory domain-containing protein [Tenacibaculum ovolyticum]
MFTKQGKIIDETGMGIPGVHISVEGNPTLGTTTDIDGNYSLLIGSEAKLNFSHLGKGIKTIEASSVPEVLKLDASFDMLDEVVLDVPPKKKSYLGWKVFGGVAGALLLFGFLSNNDEEKKKRTLKK